MKKLIFLLATMFVLLQQDMLQAQDKRKAKTTGKTEQEFPETVTINKSGNRIAFTVGKTIYCYGVSEQKMLWATDQNNPYYPLKIVAPLFVDSRRRLIFECIGNFVSTKRGLVMLDAETGYYIKNLTEEVQPSERYYVTPDEKYFISLAFGKITSRDIGSGVEIKTFPVSLGMNNYIATLPGKQELLLLKEFDGSKFGIKSTLEAKVYDFEKGIVTREQELDYSKEFPVLDSCEFIREPMNFSNNSLYIGYRNSSTGDVFTLVVNKANYEIEEQFNFQVIKASGRGALLLIDKQGYFYIKPVDSKQPVPLDEMNISHKDFFGYNFSGINDDGTVVAFIQNNKVGFRRIINGQLSGITWIAY